MAFFCSTISAMAWGIRTRAHLKKAKRALASGAVVAHQAAQVAADHGHVGLANHVSAAGAFVEAVAHGLPSSSSAEEESHVLNPV